MRNTATIASAALCLFACAPADFEQFEEISKLRVLAIRATPPDLAGDETVTLDALVASPDDLPVRYTWELCAFDEGPDGAYACAIDPDSGETLGVVISSAPTADVPGALVRELLGDVDALCASVAELDLPDFIELPDCRRGYPLRVRLTVAVGDARGASTEIAVSTLEVLRDGEVPNSNPDVGALLAAGAALGVEPRGVWIDPETPLALQATISEASAEEVADGSGAMERERLKLSWFTTHGALERAASWYAEGDVPLGELQTNELDLTDGSVPGAPGDVVTVYVVARDGRGGVDFTLGTLRIEEGSGP